MARGKMEKRDDFGSFSNCIDEDVTFKGKWHAFFGNDNPIVLELGCGKGDLGYGLALQHPEWNILGVDVKSTRMWVSAKRALEEGRKNIAFLRADIHQIELYFEEKEVRDIWITFPDPFPKKRQTRNRLTERRFLHHYFEIMDGKGKLHFKTDNDALFTWAMKHLHDIHNDGDLAVTIHAETTDLHHSDLRTPENSLITDYEQRFLDMGQTINYVCFSLTKGPKYGEKIVTEREMLEGSVKAPRRG